MSGVLENYAEAAFRTSLVRNNLKLDTNPTEQTHLLSSTRTAATLPMEVEAMEEPWCSGQGHLWHSRQTLITTSSAETELLEASEGTTLMASIDALLADVGGS